MKIFGRPIGTAKAAVVALLAIWLLALFLMSGSFSNTHAAMAQFGEGSARERESGDHMARRLDKAMQELSDLKKQNEELQALVRDVGRSANVRELRSKMKAYTGGDESSTKSSGPSAEYELARRRIESGVKEMFYYVSSELKGIQKDVMQKSQNLAKKIDDVIAETASHKRSILWDLQQLEKSDGHSEWRRQEEAALSAIVHSNLNYLQNPVDCSRAKKLLCNINKGCGYGCQMHHVVYCLILAYGTQRTLVLKSKGWRYNHNGWEDVFLPVSETCVSAFGDSRASWPGSEDTQVIDLPHVDSLSPRPPYLPLAVPKDLSERLIRLHGNPSVWWVGQMLKYLLRPQQQTQQMLDEMTKKIDFQRPIVGVHIRRTDKVGTEAAYHSLEEYMEHVDDYFKLLELNTTVDIRRIYLASDEPRVIQEARTKYPSYEIYGDSNVAKTAAVATRYSSTSLQGIIADIHFLSQCDYLVCTFSSQVCRIAYEIMQQLHTDASERFRSLDDIYYFGGQNAHNQVAVQAHQPSRPDEIELQKGDVVGVAGNHWDGFSMGRNLRTHKRGLYPSYKVVDKVEAVDFPHYPNKEEKSV